MDKTVQKCSLKAHNENDAILYCYECRIFICSKCEKLHSGLFPNHHQLNIDKDKDDDEIFTGLCTENNHHYELKYFCRTHNKLCCAECITKFKGKNHGQHTDCTVCSIEDIENEKKEKLNENIQCLDKLSVNLQESIKELKKFYEEIDKNKEEIKLNIQKVFTKFRNIINEREDKLLLDVDEKFNELYFSEDLIKESEKLPKKINDCLEKGKIIDKNWKDNLNSLINDCLNIENIIKEINRINSSKSKFTSNKNKIQFIQTDDEFNHLLERINTFGTIYENPLSEIIKKEDFDKINGWIGGNNRFILRYNAKKDGCDTEIFHKRCDDISGCIFVCKPNGKDIIGGYISTKIQKKNEFSDDSKAFLFNLTKNFVKNNKNNYSNAIKNFNDSSFFIRFGSGCNVLALSGNCFNDSKSQTTTCSCQSNFDCNNYNLFNNSSSEYFQVENFEVFQVA